MEEIIGSIPIRSTKYSNNLARANSHGSGGYVLACVIPPRFSAIAEGFHCSSFGFHADVAVVSVLERFFKRLKERKALPEELRLEIRAHRRFMPN